MKHSIFAFMAALLICTAVQGQSDEINKKNTWLKFGVNAGVPTGNLSDIYNFVGGLELKGQFMETDHVGIGLGVGYNHFFGKSIFPDFGTVPLGAFVRVYPDREGFFAGVDFGHSFITNANGADGGFFVKPQIGYHNYSWNLFGFFNQVIRTDINGGNIPHVGIAATYNIHFK